MAVRDLTSEAKFISEAFDRVLVRGDLGLEKLQGDLFLGLRVIDLIDSPPPALAQLLDDLKPAGERAAAGQLADSG